jgi:membrane-associated phospholipid phosphatase
MSLTKLVRGASPAFKPVWFFHFVTALFVLVSLTVHLRLWAGFDLASALFLQSLTPRSMDPALSVFSLIGSAEVTGLIILVYAVFFCPRGSRIRLVGLFVLIALFEWIGKNLVYQPGPPNIFYRYVLPFSFPTSGVHTPYSFPSGHSARTVLLTIVLVVWIRQSHFGMAAKQILLAVLALGEMLMLATRVTLGEHWSTDVIGGVLLATCLALPWLYSLKPTTSLDPLVPRE